MADIAVWTCHKCQCTTAGKAGDFKAKCTHCGEQREQIKVEATSWINPHVNKKRRRETR